MTNMTVAIEDIAELDTLVAVAGAGAGRVDTTGDMCLSIAVAIATYSAPTGPHR